jgi:hypothetical protein
MAGTAANITWVALSGVPRLVEEAFLSSSYVDGWAREKLIPALIAKRVRWRARAAVPAGKGDGFWQQPPHLWFSIKWVENTVFLTGVGGLVVYETCLIGVELAREDLVDLGLPAPPPAPGAISATITESAVADSTQDANVSQAPAPSPVQAPTHAPPPVVTRMEWLAKAVEVHKRGRAESMSAWARRIHGIMNDDPAVEAWPEWGSVRTSLYKL